MRIRRYMASIRAKSFAAIVLAAGTVGLGTAHGLELVYGTVEGIGPVLLLRDCEPSEKKSCAKYETQVAAGDADRIERLLSSRPVAEVWLNSGGGNSDEGQKIGNVFRRNGVAVRVRKGDLCASACTVAFLGGVIRTVDPGGRYLVHARSGYLNSVEEDLMRRTLADPAASLAALFQKHRHDSRYFVANRLIYIQGMLGGRPDQNAYASLAKKGLESQSDYIGSAEFAADVARVRVEREAAVHTIAMKFERSSFDEALAVYGAALDALGPRAAAAHRMMDAMFSTAIVRTADLSQETLYKLGFVTPILSR